MATPLPEMSTELRQGTSELSGNMRTRASNETSGQQNQLDKLRPDKGPKYSTFKHSREQAQCAVQDVHLRDRDQRHVELSGGAEVSGSGKRTGHNQKKTMGLQEYRDQQQGKGKATSAAATSSELQEPEEKDWDSDLSLSRLAPEWRHFVTQLNQDPGHGSTADSELGTVTMEEEDVKADMARDEEVEGGDGEAAIDVTLDANATDDLVWNDNNLYFKMDDESLGVHRTPVAASTPMSAPNEETVLLPPSSAGNKKLHREIPIVEPELIDVSKPDYIDVPLVEFARLNLS